MKDLDWTIIIPLLAIAHILNSLHGIHTTVMNIQHEITLLKISHCYHDLSSDELTDK